LPLQEHMQYVSVDDHLLEPPNLWQDRLTKQLCEDGPRLVWVDGPVHDDVGRVFEDGCEAWAFDGEVIAQTAGFSVAGIPPEEREDGPLSYSVIRRGSFDIAARIEDMDLDGVHAQLCFPTFPRFAGTRFLTNKNRELSLACVRAYNDFVLEEWCGHAPGRQIPMVILPLWDVDECAREVVRTGERGARAATFPENPVPLGLPSIFSDAWDPLWASLQDADMTVCTHIGTSGSLPRPAPDAPYVVSPMLCPINTWTTLISFLTSAVFSKFPGLRVSLAEGGIGWIPAALERAEDMWKIRPHWLAGVDQPLSPAELFGRNVFGCLLDDRVGIDVRHHVGVDNIMFESDYPHADSKWPDARRYAAERLAGVPDDEAHRMIELNARRVFRFPRTDSGSPAASVDAAAATVD
jgi:predicted TIM-barrel fold metal-dependent hydrolase